jgi:hypothetical protein
VARLAASGDDWQDPAFLETLVAIATTVDVSESDARTLRLGVREYVDTDAAGTYVRPRRSARDDVRLRGLVISLATPTNGHPRKRDPGEHSDKNPIHWHLPLGIALSRNRDAPCGPAPDRATAGHKRRLTRHAAAAPAIRLSDLCALTEPFPFLVVRSVHLQPIVSRTFRGRLKIDRRRRSAEAFARHP